jgi:aminoglycoside phosphotransferase family enzyme
VSDLSTSSALIIRTQFRFIDTMYDIGFVVVGLESKGRTDMSNEFLNEYLERTGDWDGVEVVPLLVILPRISAYPLLS